MTQELKEGEFMVSGHVIRVLGPDEQITEPGFYNISLDRHHDQPCDGPSVTSGVLREMELKSPADVWAYSKLNTNAEPTQLAPRRYEREQTDALLLGRARAAFVEGGMDEVAKHYFILPDDKPRVPTDKQLEFYNANQLWDMSHYKVFDSAPRKPTAAQLNAHKDGKATDTAKASIEFWAEQDAKGIKAVTQAELDRFKSIASQVEFWKAVDEDGRDPLTDAQITMIRDMGEVLASDPMASSVMGGLPEVTMAYKDHTTGLWVLSRPDTVSFDGLTTDYKKMSAQGRPFTHALVDNRITQHGYDMQGALASMAFEELTGQWPDFGIIAQSDKPPHHVILREISEEDLRFGQFRNQRALRRFAECLASGNWPGPGEDVSQYQRPQWLREKLLEEMQTEGKAP